MTGMDLYTQLLIIIITLLTLNVAAAWIITSIWRKLSPVQSERLSGRKRDWEKIDSDKTNGQDSSESSVIGDDRAISDLLTRADEILEHDYQFNGDPYEDDVYTDEEWESEMNDNGDERSLRPPVVIRVDHVTMTFKVATVQASGLKELLIMRIKGQAAYRSFNALDNVSFSVRKGEVVGIIGTNGSGKSTILKIISGALAPTDGRVIVDKRKIQILTLGTGFDRELTAKENVYLNGSIIGYSKEFLDTHYQEIVDFAELQDFMEEKVKNFSSGMVSRLGFAIATAGNAAEILILDEVLSVGDEFFRKKSLKRIKEMIHGGSTVLMVSHGMGTILDNCTKVVWIEKGRLRMVGEPKVVCKAYQGMNIYNNQNG